MIGNLSGGELHRLNLLCHMPEKIRGREMCGEAGKQGGGGADLLDHPCHCIPTIMMLSVVRLTCDGVL